MKIGISGGTFDPIHTGHLIVAEKVREILSLDKVIFMPVGIPPHKNPENVTESYHRMEMARLALIDNPFFEVSDIEVKREGVTYTIDTLRILWDVFKDDSTLPKFYYIIGSDILFSMDKWKDIAEIFKLCEFVVVLRPRMDKDKVLERIEYLRVNYSACIRTVDAPLVDVSSTFVRRMLGQNRSIKYYVPERVENYILEKKVYST